MCFLTLFLTLFAGRNERNKVLVFNLINQGEARKAKARIEYANGAELPVHLLHKILSLTMTAPGNPIPQTPADKRNSMNWSLVCFSWRRVLRLAK
jgi:hypothetical protein